MENNLEIIRTFNPHNNAITKVVDDVLIGNVESLPVYLYLKKMETTIKNALSLIQDGAVNEAARYGSGEHVLDSTKFQVKGSPGKYVYSDWVQKAETEFKRRKELEQEAFKLSKHSQTIVDGSTGEIVKPANFYDGKQTISVTVPKT